jgi:hypothetical protein
MMNARVVLLLGLAACSDASTPPSDAGADAMADAAIDVDAGSDAHDAALVLPDGGPACAAASASGSMSGCDFVVPQPMHLAGDKAGCFVVYLANTWNEDVPVTKLERGGVTYEATAHAYVVTPDKPIAGWPPLPPTGVPVGKAAAIILSEDPQSGNPCPNVIAPAVMADTGIEGTARGQAWHIATDGPVVAWDETMFGGLPTSLADARAVPPTSTWGTQYIAVVPRPGDPLAGTPGQQYGQIVALTDDTTITVTPSIDLPSGTSVVAAPKGSATQYTLGAGEIVQWAGTPLEMTGAIMTSTAPFAFIGGSSDLRIYVSYDIGGSVHVGATSDFIPPVRALGSEYAIAQRALTPANSVPQARAVIAPYRIVGLVDGTTLTYDPPMNVNCPPTSPNSPCSQNIFQDPYHRAGMGPATLARGQLVDFDEYGAFDVRSQDDAHPFYIAEMPHFTSLSPLKQLATDTAFAFTDGTFGTTAISIVRARSDAGFASVSVDGVSLDDLSWSSFGDGGASALFQHQTTQIRWNYKLAGTTSDGPHAVTSSGPFAVETVATYTWEEWTAMPGASQRATINAVTLP